MFTCAIDNASSTQYMIFVQSYVDVYLSESEACRVYVETQQDSVRTAHDAFIATSIHCICQLAVTTH